MGGGIFEARPNPGTTLAGGQTITFLLHDVEVAVGEDDGTITVTEFPLAGDEPTRLTVEKVKPVLRVDEFRAEPPEIKIGQSAKLSWATTAADTVTISGPGLDGAASRAKDSDKDSTIDVSPRSTAAYTLTARNSGGARTAQVVVTVLDHIELADPKGSANLGQLVTAASAMFPRLAVGNQIDFGLSDRPQGSTQLGRLAVGDLSFASSQVSAIGTGDVQVQHKLGVGTATPADSGDLAVENKVTAKTMKIGDATFRAAPSTPGDSSNLETQFDIRFGGFLRTDKWRVGNGGDDGGDFFFMEFSFGSPTPFKFYRIQFYASGRIDQIFQDQLPNGTIRKTGRTIQPPA
ncbi:MAG: hypothetical protein NTW28_36765 [Candidatus Solibacter sp.]|nr:hypothetical protein [Candidatus Solibacter sp.]